MAMKLSSANAKRTNGSPSSIHSILSAASTSSSFPDRVPCFDKNGETRMFAFPPLSFSAAAMNVFVNTSSIVLSVLKFDVCEMWIRMYGCCQPAGSSFPYLCINNFTSTKMSQSYSSLASSSVFPVPECTSCSSPHMCDLARQQKDQILWRNGTEKCTDGDIHRPEYSTLFKNEAYGTAMAQSLYNDSRQGLEFFIVAYSTNKMDPMQDNVPRFTEGLKYGLELINEVESAGNSHQSSPLHFSESSSSGATGIGPSNLNDDTGSLPTLNVDTIEGDASYVLGTTPRKVRIEIDDFPQYKFPIEKIPVAKRVPCDLNFYIDLADVNKIADGMSANIYIATYNSEKVIVKMLKEELRSDDVACQEFETEFNVLLRLDHPHIVDVLGGGYLPRRFMVMEYLEGDTLQQLLAPNDRVDMGLAQKLMHQPSFTFMELISKLGDLASALAYLHSSVHPGASIIHRDLKPGNIGFKSDGTIKLFDFGLCTCIKMRANPTDVYEMTGNTGSLRYMAPEVALKNAYTELVDVYSYGMVAWQMAKDKVPFRSLDKIKFFNEVILKGARPRVEDKWPSAFQNLLRSCWDQESMKRPSFATIHMQLKSIQESEEKRAKLSWTRGMLKKRSGFSDDFSNHSINSAASHLSTISVASAQTTRVCESEKMKGNPGLSLKTSSTKNSSSKSAENKTDEKPVSPLKRFQPEARDSSWF